MSDLLKHYHKIPEFGDAGLIERTSCLFRKIFIQQFAHPAILLKHGSVLRIIF